LHFHDDEPTTKPVSAYGFDFEKFSLSKDDFKDLMLDQTIIYHSDDTAFKNNKEKEANPWGAFHLKYGDLLRKAFKEQWLILPILLISNVP